MELKKFNLEQGHQHFCYVCGKHASHIVSVPGQWTRYLCQNHTDKAKANKPPKPNKSRMK